MYIQYFFAALHAVGNVRNQTNDINNLNDTRIIAAQAAIDNVNNLAERQDITNQLEEIIRN